MERKISPRDYYLIQSVVEKTADKAKRSGSKLWFKYIDAPTVMSALYDLLETYIVEETYLVAYDISSPWYAKDDIEYLQEALVLRLGGSASFSAVPAFLERKAKEAGAKLACAGTALARSDKALASLYTREGYSIEDISMVKEVNG